MTLHLQNKNKTKCLKGHGYCPDATWQEKDGNKMINGRKSAQTEAKKEAESPSVFVNDLEAKTSQNSES